MKPPLNPYLVLAVAMVLPGMGQVLNRQPVRGLIFVCFAILLGAFTLKTAAPDVSFVGKGCAISMASASLMTEIVRDKTRDEVDKLYEAFHRMCTEEDVSIAAETGIDPDEAERLEVLSGVRQFPVRVKCATLAWHAMNAALHGQDEASTEG